MSQYHAIQGVTSLDDQNLTGLNSAMDALSIHISMKVGYVFVTKTGDLRMDTIQIVKPTLVTVMRQYAQADSVLLLATVLRASLTLVSS